jgi:hypothetical protein
MTFFSGPTNAPPQALVGPHTLSGTVLDAVNGEPIQRAQVQLNGVRQDAVLTDASGRFSFEKLPPGTYNIHSARPGYLGIGRSSSVVEVGPKSSGQTILKLNPVATIEGTITDVEGEPLEGINVSALRSQVVDGRRRWLTRGSAQTDADGHYRIAGLEPGLYIVKTAFRPRYPRWRVESTDGEGYRGVYFPAATDRASASRLEVAAGQGAPADFELRAEATFRVSGFMEYEGQWASIQAFDSDGESVTNTTVNPESGRFDLQGLAAGSYKLRGDVITQNGLHSTAALLISVGPSRSDLTLAARPDLSIPIKARLDSSEQRATSETVNLLHAAASSIRLEEVSGAQSMMPMMAGTSPTGEVSLRSVSTGVYNAEFNSFSPCNLRGDEVRNAAYITSARAGSIDLMHDALTITDGSQPEAIEIVLKDDAAALMVYANNLDPFTPAMLIAVPDDSQKDPIVRSLYMLPGAAPAEISSSVCGLPPGGYSVTVVKNGNEFEYKNPDALAPFLSKAVHVQLNPKRVTKVRVEALGLGD